MLTATPRPETPLRRRILWACLAGAVAGAVLASAPVVLARFSATRSSTSNSVAAGTVTLTSNVSGACSATNMLPGSTPAPCTLTATYSGSVSAYMGLDVLIETQAGNGGTNLYNPADSTHALQVTIASSNPTVASYTLPTTSTTCPGGAPSGSTCYRLDNELVSLSALAAAPPNSTVTFTTTVSLPSTTTTGYRGGAAQVILTAHATQSSNNGSTSGCTAGQSCAPVHWS
jgi:hypothetical protein